MKNPWGAAVKSIANTAVFCVKVQPMKTLIPMIFLFLLTSCGAKIGDSCGYDADCSPNGDRNCENGQPGGYCLMITCVPDGCPDEASCVEFITPSPDFGAQTSEDTSQTSIGALYEQITANRSRTYCLKRCRKNSNCRGSYHCAIGDELNIELNGSILDYNQGGKGVCVPGKPPSKSVDATDTDSSTDTEADTDTTTDSL